MKILQYGEGYPKTVTCDKCKSKLEYDAADVFSFTDIYSDHTEKTDYIKCPVCSRSIEVNVFVNQFYTDKQKKRWWQR